MKPFPLGGQPADYGIPRVVAPNRQDAYRGRYADSSRRICFPRAGHGSGRLVWRALQSTGRERAVSVEWIPVQLDAGIKIQGELSDLKTSTREFPVFMLPMIIWYCGPMAMMNTGDSP